LAGTDKNITLSIPRSLKLIKDKVVRFTIPSVTLVSHQGDPYQVLISCILSLRTKDKTTIEASKRLFKVAVSPKSMIKLPLKRIEQLIYPVGFYRTKANNILDLSRRIITEFKGKVPGNINDLLSFKGVGRKTANLVLGLGFKIPAICVDTHVHRISNRLGWVKTGTAQETERSLEKIIPRKSWIDLNTILVTFGQNLCVPVSPFCSICNVNNVCKKVGVVKSR
jgi:endonuclease-3